MTTIRSIKSTGRSPSRLALLLFPLVFACFALLSKAQAQLPPPPPDGGYPGGNTAEGTRALQRLTTGASNTALGFQTLSSDTIGSNNTATGAASLSRNFDGAYNTATGVLALADNISGSSNTASGVNALVRNITGNSNTAVGVNTLFHNNANFQTAVGRDALSANTSGQFNSATGAYSLANNTEGSQNTANGYQALYSNTTGVQNTATGQGALYWNISGDFNTAHGVQALDRNTDGRWNTAVGYQPLFFNTLGFSNTAIGDSALRNNTEGAENTAVGGDALQRSTGTRNTALGLLAGNNVTTASNVICIGAFVTGANVSNSCYIGEIFNRTSSGGTAVFINSDGKLGTTTSSRRFKDEIKSMGQASEALYALKPVTFRYKKEIDPASTSQFGLVAEEVEKVHPDLVVRDKEGKPYTVRYDQVNAMLLNEFLKEHSAVQELKKEIATLAATVKEQSAQIQKVSAQLELNKPAPQTVKNTD